MVTPKRAAAPRKRRARPNANTTRGEHQLTLEGITYRLRPSYAAIVAIEAELGRSAIQLLREANAMALGFEDQGVIVAELIRAGAEEDDAMTRSVSAERVSQLIFEEGSAGALVTIVASLAAAVSGGRTTSGEAKPVATTA